jgi:hypothetical protein
MLATSFSRPLNLGSAKSIVCHAPSKSSAIVDQGISPKDTKRFTCDLGFEALTTPWRAHSPTVWPRPSGERSNAIAPALIQRQTPKPSSKACQSGPSATIPFVSTAPCAIVRHESSSLRNQTGMSCPVSTGINTRAADRAPVGHRPRESRRLDLHRRPLHRRG